MVRCLRLLRRGAISTPPLSAAPPAKGPALGGLSLPVQLLSRTY
jgi:hypothetical protein